MLSTNNEQRKPSTLAKNSWKPVMEIIREFQDHESWHSSNHIIYWQPISNQWKRLGKILSVVAV
jgi:hypothetical protein